MRGANKRKVPGGGVRFIWEVADCQYLFLCFSNEYDKQGVAVFPCRSTSGFEAKASS